MFEYYRYGEVNIFFSLLILIISLLYLIMFAMLVRDNFKNYFIKKDEIRDKLTKEAQSYGDGVVFDNLTLYVRGTTLTLFYLLLSPVIASLISLVLAFFSPLLSIVSFLLILFLRFFIRMRRIGKDELSDIELSEDEKHFVEDIKLSIYGE